MGLYDELPLKPADQTIRLLKLHTANDRSDPLIADLTVVSLDSNPSFAALSYCWGPPAFTRSIICNSTALDITESLSLALSSIRSMSSLPLWVDQICIHQDDLSERSSQVSCMKRIYSQASETIVYLGEPEPEAADAFKALKTVIMPAANIRWQSVKEDSLTQFYVKVPATRFKLAVRHPHLTMKIFDKRMTRMTGRMIERPYYSRKWLALQILFHIHSPAF